MDPSAVRPRRPRRRGRPFPPVLLRCLALAWTLCAGATGADVPDSEAARGAGARTLGDAIYTREQARSGEALFGKHCRRCHGPDYFTPVLRAWDGERLDAFLNVMSATMPQSNPGSLPLPDYVQILAYILDENDFPDGEEPLDDWGRGLDGIVITAP